MKFLLIIMLFCLASLSHAEFFKANQLKEHCFRDGKYHEGLCLGYIMGVYDGIRLIEENWHDGNFSICLPENTKSGDLKKVITELLDSEELDNMKNKAADTVWQALLKEYHCK